MYDYDLVTRQMVLRKQKPVLPGPDGRPYDPAEYEQHRDWALADDGTRVPISLVCRVGTPRDGSAPCELYGYGSYEASMDPWFSVARLSLLDRGVVFAVAHTRGGGELGRRWYDQGKMLAKKNTFTDFVACARHLVKAGWTASDRLVARGASAGGLLMGAVANLAPDAFTGIVAQVPFVDALTSILDPSLPLTVTEWEEWGNPLEDPEVYAYMKSYTPYENVTAVDYPAILAVTSLNDTRVLYSEPAKWIARLRAVAPRRRLPAQDRDGCRARRSERSLRRVARGGVHQRLDPGPDRPRLTRRVGMIALDGGSGPLGGSGRPPLPRSGAIMSRARRAVRRSRVPGRCRGLDFRGDRDHGW